MRPLNVIHILHKKRVSYPRRALLALFLIFFIVFVSLLFNADEALRSELFPRTKSFSLHKRTATWPLHSIDLSAGFAGKITLGDVDGNKTQDIITLYPKSGQIRLSLHPITSPTFAWQTSSIGMAMGATDLCLYDINSDGKTDALISCSDPNGGSNPKNNKGGIFALIHPGDNQMKFDQTWQKVVFSATHNMQFRSILPGNITLQDVPQFLLVGKYLEKDPTKFYCLSAPTDPLLRKSLSRWSLTPLFVDNVVGQPQLFDADIDGDTDVLYYAATPNKPLRLCYLENPGYGITAPWKNHVLYEGKELSPDMPMLTADLTGDGRQDIALQTQFAIYLFENRKSFPQRFDLKMLPKDPISRYAPGDIKAIDADKDGKLELATSLVSQGGSLTRGQCAVGIYDLAEPPLDHFGMVVHPVKWGDGAIGLFGLTENWTNLLPADVDGDGDMDLVAICRGYQRISPILSVCWFENPLKK